MFRIIIIRRVPMILELNEVTSHRIQFVGEGGAILDALHHPIADLSHSVMRKGPRQNTALSFDCPLADRLIDQKMEEGIIGSRDRSSKTGLFGFRWLLIREIIGLLKQVLRKGHLTRTCLEAQLARIRSSLCSRHRGLSRPGSRIDSSVASTLFIVS